MGICGHSGKKFSHRESIILFFLKEAVPSQKMFLLFLIFQSGFSNFAARKINRDEEETEKEHLLCAGGSVAGTCRLSWLPEERVLQECL
jgi:hypothetical protein